MSNVASLMSKKFGKQSLFLKNIETLKSPPYKNIHFKHKNM